MDRVSIPGWFFFSVTPFDVVKIRLQSQKVPLVKGKCFLYCNGLMDHLCTCLNGPSNNGYWYKRKVPGHYKGTVVGVFINRRTWSGRSRHIIYAITKKIGSKASSWKQTLKVKLQKKDFLIQDNHLTNHVIFKYYFGVLFLFDKFFA